MEQFGMTLLYILLFLLCLSILVVVHELGHLTAAKIFKVYCHEFSVGMGPKIFSRKRKNGETYFSLRWVPFGGFVSMYGEEESIPEDLNIDPSRSLNAIKRWKRAIIMVAGVTMNFVLALILFFISNSCFEQKQVYANVAKVAPNSDAQLVYNIQDLDVIKLPTKPGPQEGTFEYIIINDLYMLVDKEASISYKNGSPTRTCAAVFSRSIKNYEQLSWTDYLHYFPVDAGGNIDTNPNAEYMANANVDKVSFALTYLHFVSEDQDPIENTVNVHISTDYDAEKETYFYKDFGLSMYLDAYWNTYGQSVQKTFEDFGNSSIAIFKGLGMLFTPAGFEQAGGIIAIGFESTNVLKNLGLGKFIYLWGLISVNLGIVNLFPFPGLDGWHFLVIIVEGIFHKEIPQKVKTILSLIGLALLIMLMVALIFKDVFRYII